MLLQIDKRSGTPIFRQLLDQLKNQILSGQLASGTQLTSVRDVAAELRVNPMTVSKVYSMLETEGLLERRPGIGLFVADGAKLRGERQRLALLERPLRDAARQAAELGISAERAQELFAKVLRGAHKPGGSDD
jgi:GntR family transcriptional regulator